jgi:hypothetical protein
VPPALRARLEAAAAAGGGGGAAARAAVERAVTGQLNRCVCFPRTGHAHSMAESSAALASLPCSPGGPRHPAAHDLTSAPQGVSFGTAFPSALSCLAAILLARLAEANLQPITAAVAELYGSRGRRAVAEAVANQILGVSHATNTSSNNI